MFMDLAAACEHTSCASKGLAKHVPDMFLCLVPDMFLCLDESFLKNAVLGKFVLEVFCCTSESERGRQN